LWILAACSPAQLAFTVSSSHLVCGREPHALVLVHR
jgi:hypothetical protein